MKTTQKPRQQGNANVSLYVPPGLRERMRRFEAKVGVTTSEMTRRALTAYLDEQEQRYGK